VFGRVSWCLLQCAAVCAAVWFIVLQSVAVPHVACAMIMVATPISSCTRCTGDFCFGSVSKWYLCVPVYSCLLQSVAVPHVARAIIMDTIPISSRTPFSGGFLQCVAVCCGARCSVMQCVAVRCSVLQCVAVVPHVTRAMIMGIILVSALQCVAVRCSVLQCVALCCTVLQCPMSLVL